jgi:hypothetical protein
MIAVLSQVSNCLLMEVGHKSNVQYYTLDLSFVTTKVNQFDNVASAKSFIRCLKNFMIIQLQKMQRKQMNLLFFCQNNVQFFYPVQ